MNPIAQMVKRYIDMPLKKALLLLFIGVFVLASTAGCITSTKNTTSSESNEKDVSSGLEISSATLVSNSTLSVRWMAPQAGNVFVVYNCTVKNIGADGVDLRTVYWHLQGPSGYYDAVDFGGKICQRVVAPEFNRILDSSVGNVASGYVYFEVPADAAIGPWTLLRFTNEGWSSDGPFTFDLSVNV